MCGHHAMAALAGVLSHAMAALAGVLSVRYNEHFHAMAALA